MDEPTYLYGYGNRRHIAVDPEAVRLRDSGYGLCGTHGHNAAWTERDLRLWNKPAVVDRQMASRRNLPVCKRCQKAWDKQVWS